MVRANGANRNAKIHAPLPFRPQVRRSRFNVPFPAAGAGAARWPLGQRTARARRGRAARAAALRERLLRASWTGPRRSLTPSERGDRSSANTGEPRGREGAADARQRSASPRTTRKDPGSGEAARIRLPLFSRRRASAARSPESASPPYWASAFSAAISAFMSSSAFEGCHGSPRLANSIARPAPWAVCAASCATI